MARNRKEERNNIDEPTDVSHMRHTNVERSDRTMGAGARGDGSPGIEDPARERGRREDADGNSRSFSGQGGQKEGSHDREGTGYTSESEPEELEGTGYRPESETDESDS